MTPEGKVKAAVNKLLKPYIDAGLIYRFMPVQTGFGKKTLDYLLCAGGVFVAIETKALGKTPTAMQESCIREIQNASGRVFVIDSPTCSEFARLKSMLRSELPYAVTLIGRDEEQTKGSSAERRTVPLRP